MRKPAENPGSHQRGAEPQPPSEFQLVVGRNIQRLREEQQLTVQQLATDCRLKPLRLQRLEEGEVNLQLAMLVRIARRLRVLPEALLNGVQ